MQHLFLSCKMKNQGCKKNHFLRGKHIDLLANSHFTRISKFGTGAELFINFFYLQFWRENFPKIFLNLCRIVLPSINTLPFLDKFKVITLSTNQV